MCEQAKRLGCQRRLFLGLFLAHQLLEAPLPTEVEQKLYSDSSITWLCKRIYQRLFRQVDQPPKLFEQAFFDLVCLERLQDKRNYLRDRSILLIAKKFRLGFAQKYGLPGGK